MKVKFNIRGVIYGIIVLILLLGGFVFVPKMFMDDSKPVDYIMLQKNEIPEKILDMMGKYTDEERALAVKLDGKIYVVVTRGKDTNKGIEMNSIKMFKEEDKNVMKVEVVHKNKEESHPYIVVETNLKELPDRIELNSKVEK
ncbi:MULTISPECIES: hypothetical protein [Paraclostridium]|uniref:PrcB C-terminal domain-containing protein n=1 Tax=Paraclostridium benzoelyticum TaxID=1629550 RepID=A0A0M3DH23_9FIRM|nr:MULTISPECIES: hypothetical protein [Paraclostridium]KKY01920.1 hypothetical protein VN21_06185 [Paraclostridium benzoelyticum]MCU9815049.1 hypothetical protein [Paraclostridium sp. AKS73]OXX83733.1 hypothetical protein AVM15_08890 [Paraclostridium benzoelyticum]